MGPVLATDSKPSYMMKAFAIVLLAAVAVKAEADADAYTIGQVNHGFTHGGIITGVDYGHGVVSGVGAIGNRGVYGVHGVHTGYAGPYAANVYGHGVYGKREAEADAEADPYFLNGVYGTGIHGVATTYGHHGVVGAVHSVAAAVPAVHTTVAAAVPVVHSVAAVNHVAAVPAVHTGVVSTYGHHVAAAVPAVHTVAAVPAVHSTVAAVPAVHTSVGGYTAASGVNHGVYGHYYGKREAEAEADAEADPYFLNGVYGTGIHGVATTYGHHGVVGAVHSTVAAVPAVHTTVAAAVPAVHSAAGGYTAVSGINHGVYGGIYNRHFYGKREADAEPEPYTIGQVAYGLPVHNAYATGHPHNVGYTNY